MPRAESLSEASAHEPVIEEVLDAWSSRRGKCVNWHYMEIGEGREEEEEDGASRTWEEDEGDRERSVREGGGG